MLSMLLRNNSDGLDRSTKKRKVLLIKTSISFFLVDRFDMRGV